MPAIALGALAIGGAVYLFGKGASEAAGAVDTASNATLKLALAAAAVFAAGKVAKVW